MDEKEKLTLLEGFIKASSYMSPPEFYRWVRWYKLTHLSSEPVKEEPVKEEPSEELTLKVVKYYGWGWTEVAIFNKEGGRIGHFNCMDTNFAREKAKGYLKNMSKFRLESFLKRYGGEIYE